MDEIQLTIDGQAIKAHKGMTVLEAAQSAGIYIPTLCYHPDLEPYGGCRMCVVEIEKMRGLPTSCTTPATDGMVVHTETPAVDKVRRTVIDLLLAEHPLDCLTCQANQHCELQKVAAYLGITERRFPLTDRKFEIDSSNPFFDLDRNKCILCARCTRTCNEITCVGAIDISYRGYQAKVATFNDTPLMESICKSCGECVAHCPVGALIPKKYTQPTREVVTTCPYCGVGCQMYLGIRNEKIVGVRGKSEGTTNHGWLCVKGRYGIPEFVHSPERLTTPFIRKDGKLVEASWDEALSLVARELSKYKGDEVGVISSAKATNEENYLIQKFARVVMQTNNVDHCARLCHSPSVAGLLQSFGSGAMTNSSNELRDAACIFAIGTNTTAAHPIIGFIIKQGVRKGTKLIVANPREIDLCAYADIWLRQRPGTDIALMNGMARYILDNGLADLPFIEKRCENFDAFKASLADYDLDAVERITGVPKEKIAEAARLYATSQPSSIVYAMGITQHTHGTDNVMATANLAMLTGQIGKPSSGVNPLRGQNNVQGSCDMGALPNVYTGYQSVTDPAISAKHEAAWGCHLSEKPGLTLTEIFDKAHQRQIKAIYLVGENPVLADASAKHVEEALAETEFLVVQDIFMSETAKFAHVVLPAASFAEKDGTFTNTERRVQRVRQALAPVGNSKADWWITCEIARRMDAKGFDFTDPVQIMDEIARVTPSYGGISFARLEKESPHWPCPTLEHPGTPVLHTQQFTRGKGRFIPLAYRPSAELPDDEYPLLLTTERSLFQYHTGTLSRKVKGLNRFVPEERLQINPTDAERLNISDGEVVKVSSRRGEVTVKAKVTEASPAGVVSLSFHFAETPTNQLTNSALDPISKMPEFKVCAVKVKKIGKEEPSLMTAGREKP
ncbi:MAG: formate dehydrogenase subunit alpha [Chloroflexi bacterium]|nr:formate dehydrogenase subunit alpha [Chloroflexota bacterium]